MSHNESLRRAVLERLSAVIDPETGIDIVRMRLIEDLQVDDDGHVACVFRPSSVFCPIAVPLSVSIQRAIAETRGVTAVNVEVVGFALSEELTRMLEQS